MLLSRFKKQYCSFLFFLTVFVVFSFQAYGQPPRPQTSPPSLWQRYHFTDADVGYVLFDLTDGRPIEAHRPDEPRIPASTAKVVTTTAALQILGSSYRFETTLFVTGAVREGVLYGAVFLRGGGDPTLSTDDLWELTSALERVGVKRVVGSFAFDESFLLTTREIST